MGVEAGGSSLGLPAGGSSLGLPAGGSSLGLPAGGSSLGLLVGGSSVAFPAGGSSFAFFAPPTPSSSNQRPPGVPSSANETTSGAPEPPFGPLPPLGGALALAPFAPFAPFAPLRPLVGRNRVMSPKMPVPSRWRASVPVSFRPLTMSWPQKPSMMLGMPVRSSTPTTTPHTPPQKLSAEATRVTMPLMMP